MPKQMKVTQADGSAKTVEDLTFKAQRTTPKFKQHQPRSKVIEIILKAIELQEGQTIDQLAISTNIPVYFLRNHLLNLEKEKKITRSGPRHYLVAKTPPESEFVT